MPKEEVTQDEKKQEKKPLRKKGGRFGHGRKKEEQEYDQKIIDVARVTRVTEGGKQLSFRATVVIGDNKGMVGLGVGKGLDVTRAINKAVGRAKTKMVKVPINDQGTIPHEVKQTYGAAEIMIRPAPQGTGIIAGGVMRMIMDVAGVKNVIAKMYGSGSKINNSRATIEAIKRLETPDRRKKIRGV